MGRKRAKNEPEQPEAIGMRMMKWLRARWFTLTVIGGIAASMFVIRSISDIRRWWDANPDRQLAEFVIKRDGTLVAATSDKPIENYAHVPFGRFEIREVSLSKASLRDEDLQSLAGRRDIEVLNLSNNFLTDASIATLTSMSSLRELDLTRTHVTAKGVEQLQRKLRDCNITARPDDNFGQWALETKLGKSIVVEVDLSSRGTRGRRKCSTLDELPDQSLTIIEADFSGVEAIDDEAALHLARLDAVEALLLDGTAITDKAVDVLVTLKSLKRLSVCGTGLSEMGLSRLREVLGDAVVVW